MLKWTRASWGILILFAVFVFSLGVPSAFSQASISTGNVVGTVADETGAVVPNAKVTIINKATGHQLVLAANDSGLYSSGPWVLENIR